MFWLLLSIAAVGVVIFWKLYKKDQFHIVKTPTVNTVAPITLDAPITSQEASHISVEFTADSSLEKDAWEDWSAELYAEASRELTVELTIQYCDRNGQITNRDIDVQKYARTSEGGVLAAFCHLRQSRRPFYFSRIQLVADRNDGTVIENLGAWLDERYEVSPKGVRDRFVRSHEAALSALFFVAKADNAFHAKEKGVIATFCECQGLEDKSIQLLVVDVVAHWDVPSRIAFGKDLKSLLECDENYRRTVFEYAEKIINTGKTIREEETRALDRMRRELKLS